MLLVMTIFWTYISESHIQYTQVQSNVRLIEDIGKGRHKSVKILYGQFVLVYLKFTRLCIRPERRGECHSM
jgi:hypothetical protein